MWCSRVRVRVWWRVRAVRVCNWVNDWLASSHGVFVQAMRAPGVPAPDEEAGAAAAAVAVAPAEVDGLAGNDSLDSGASTKPDVELSKPDDMLE